MEQELIMKYEPLIYKISKKFYNAELSDLYQAGCIGLIKAYRAYDESKNNFVNFAYKYIFGEMYMQVNNMQNIRLNKEYMKLSKLINRTINNLFQKTGVMPSTRELSNYLEIDEHLIIDILELTKDFVSLDAPTNGDNITFMDTLGMNIDIDNKILIEESLERLEPLEKEIIVNRYFNDLTQDEIAKMLGLTQVKVSRLEQKGKLKIKEYIKS